ncbi:MAG: dihydroorotase, partial [Pacificimonas sp.]
LESYVEVFEDEGALDRFEAFASLNGPKFYGLPVNDERVRLTRVDSEIESLPDPDDPLTFAMADKWRWRFDGVVS